ncbi:DNA-binding transcriptional MerR regulator [Lipingzhangella halophila]|uniref:DNA-binding transcriptional MerR regulator n=1 Tax=Lipingzhangella halophila TaxID=1783352 RepID=A0A7W7RGC8_9ACTN|nr:MerR family transcriptional regulator [Lipingzhangella halophila]MBB4931491.1 DNA-binding transcriptional MerR regulator [Lipingzhangella halophila]
MRIGELSRRTGVSARLLRYYEEQGLLHPLRGPSGYREYNESDVGTVRRVRTLLAAGLATSTIAEVLPCMGDAGEHVAPTCAEMLVDLYRERARISGAIGELESARAMLDAVIAAAPPEETQRYHRWFADRREEPADEGTVSDLPSGPPRQTPRQAG